MGTTPRLELDTDSFRSSLNSLRDHLTKYISHHYEGLGLAAYLHKEEEGGSTYLPEEFPEKGRSLESLFSQILSPKFLENGVNPNHSGYLAYIPVGGNLVGSLGDLMTSVLNRWPGLHYFSPEFMNLERTVLAWIADLMGMPSSTRGVLLSGGSTANFSALFVARCVQLQEEDLPLGVVYSTDQAHHSLKKAAKMAGIRIQNTIQVPRDDHGKMSIPDLLALIKEHKASGLRPFFIHANCGTTNTGAVDPLKNLRDVATEHGLWLHVDAAWAGSFALTDRGRRALDGSGLGDSLTFDPHKALYAPFGSGALLVRDPSTLERAFSSDASYLPLDDQSDEAMNSGNISPELSRPLRALQTYLPLCYFGRKAYRETLDERLDLCDQMISWAAEQANCEIYKGSSLGIAVFRFIANPSFLPDNEWNQSLISSVNQDGRVHISGTTIDDVFWIRVVPFGFRTTKEDLLAVQERLEGALNKK